MPVYDIGTGQVVVIDEQSRKERTVRDVLGDLGITV